MLMLNSLSFRYRLSAVLTLAVLIGALVPGDVGAADRRAQVKSLPSSICDDPLWLADAPVGVSAIRTFSEFLILEPGFGGDVTGSHYTDYLRVNDYPNPFGFTADTADATEPMSGTAADPGVGLPAEASIEATYELAPNGNVTVAASVHAFNEAAGDTNLVTAFSFTDYVFTACEDQARLVVSANDYTRTASGLGPLTDQPDAPVRVALTTGSITNALRNDFVELGPGDSVEFLLDAEADYHLGLVINADIGEDEIGTETIDGAELQARFLPPCQIGDLWVC